MVILMAAALEGLPFPAWIVVVVYVVGVIIAAPLIGRFRLSINDDRWGIGIIAMLWPAFPLLLAYFVFTGLVEALGAIGQWAAKARDEDDCCCGRCSAMRRRVASAKRLEGDDGSAGH